MNKTMSRAPDGSPGRATTADRATAHEIYVSNPEKVEAISPDLFERYLGTSRIGAGKELEGVSRASLIASNISSDPKVREAFWQAVWAFERTPGEHEVKLFENLGAIDDWQRIARAPDTPARVADAARDIARTRALRQVDGNGSANSDACILVPLVDDHSIEWAKLLPLPRKGEAPALIRYKEPRGGLVQRRFVIEVPVEVDAFGRWALVHDIAGFLAARGFMYTIVVHAPDARNDARNHHIHVILYERRCTWLEEHGAWDIELTRAERRARGLEIAPKFRAPSATLEELAKVAAHGPSPRAHAIAWSAELTRLRWFCAESMNRQLERVGASRRIDARTYEEMGIDRQPQQHLGSDAARLVAMGREVASDQRNGDRDWAARYREHDATAARRRRFYTGDVARNERFLNAPGSQTLSEADRTEFAELVARYGNMVAVQLDRQEAFDRLVLEDTETRSAAARLIKNCDRALGSIAAGTATKREVADETAVRSRRDLAEHHLAEIDTAIAPWARESIAVGEELARNGAAIDQLREQLNVRRKVLEGRAVALEGQARWEAGTVLDLDDYPRRLSPLAHWDALRAWLETTNKHIMRQLAGSGTIHYHVAELGSADDALLRDGAFRSRAQAYLRSRHGWQEKQIDRLVAWAEAHGRARLALPADDRAGPPKAIRNIYLELRQHPELQQRLARLPAIAPERCVDGPMASAEKDRSSLAGSAQPTPLPRTDAAAPKKLDPSIAVKATSAVPKSPELVPARKQVLERSPPAHPLVADQSEPVKPSSGSGISTPPTNGLRQADAIVPSPVTLDRELQPAPRREGAGSAGEPAPANTVGSMEGNEVVAQTATAHLPASTTGDAGRADPQAAKGSATVSVIRGAPPAPEKPTHPSGRGPGTAGPASTSAAATAQSSQPASVAGVSGRADATTHLSENDGCAQSVMSTVQQAAARAGQTSDRDRTKLPSGAALVPVTAGGDRMAASDQNAVTRSPDGAASPLADTTNVDFTASGLVDLRGRQPDVRPAFDPALRENQASSITGSEQTGSHVVSSSGEQELTGPDADRLGGWDVAKLSATPDPMTSTADPVAASHQEEAVLASRRAEQRSVLERGLLDVTGSRRRRNADMLRANVRVLERLRANGLLPDMLEIEVIADALLADPPVIRTEKVTECQFALRSDDPKLISAIREAAVSTEARAYLEAMLEPLSQISPLREDERKSSGAQGRSAAASEPPVPSPASTVAATAIVAQSQHDFERLDRDKNERADPERRARRASLDRVLADVSQSADFRPALNNPTRSFIADLEALRDEIDGDRLWLTKDGRKVQVSTCGGVDQDLFGRLEDVLGRTALTKLAEVLASHAQPDVPWNGGLTLDAALVGQAHQGRAQGQSWDR